VKVKAAKRLTQEDINTHKQKYNEDVKKLERQNLAFIERACWETTGRVEGRD
jgi:hypothetical protein